MRPQKIDDYTLLSGLMAVLSSKGYDGASLNELAASSGLQKASLYHRFPNGKKEIALAVLHFVDNWVEQHIVKTLVNEEIPPIDRLTSALDKINELYSEGKSTCLLRALSLDNGAYLFNVELKQAIKKWLIPFQHLGKSFGMSETLAYKTAINVLTKIQGSLVVGKILNDNLVFKEALVEIKEIYQQ